MNVVVAILDITVFIDIYVVDCVDVVNGVLLILFLSREFVVDIVAVKGDIVVVKGVCSRCNIAVVDILAVSCW